MRREAAHEPHDFRREAVTLSLIALLQYTGTPAPKLMCAKCLLGSSLASLLIHRMKACVRPLPIESRFITHLRPLTYVVEAPLSAVFLLSTCLEARELYNMHIAIVC